MTPFVPSEPPIRTARTQNTAAFLRDGTLAEGKLTCGARRTIGLIAPEGVRRLLIRRQRCWRTRSRPHAV